MEKNHDAKSEHTATHRVPPHTPAQTRPQGLILFEARWRAIRFGACGWRGHLTVPDTGSAACGLSEVAPVWEFGRLTRAAERGEHQEAGFVETAETQLSQRIPYGFPWQWGQPEANAAAAAETWLARAIRGGPPQQEGVPSAQAPEPSPVYAAIGRSPLRSSRLGSAHPKDST